MNGYKKIASDYRLWQEYVDPYNEMSEEEFNCLTIEQKVQIQTDAFGEETEQ